MSCGCNNPQIIKVPTASPISVDSIDLRPTGNENEFTIDITWTDENGLQSTLTDGTPIMVNIPPLDLTVNAGGTGVASDDSKGTAEITDGEVIHFWSSDGSVGIQVSEGSAIVDIIVNPAFAQGLVESITPTGIDFTVDGSGDYFVQFSYLDADGNPQTVTDPTPVTLPDLSGTVQTATVALTTTNGVAVAIGQPFVTFPDGTTWANPEEPAHRHESIYVSTNFDVTPANSKEVTTRTYVFTGTSSGLVATLPAGSDPSTQRFWIINDSSQGHDLILNADAVVDGFDANSPTSVPAGCKADISYDEFGEKVYVHLVCQCSGIDDPLALVPHHPIQSAALTGVSGTVLAGQGLTIMDGTSEVNDTVSRIVYLQLGNDGACLPVKETVTRLTRNGNATMLDNGAISVGFGGDFLFEYEVVPLVDGTIPLVDWAIFPQGVVNYGNEGFYVVDGRDQPMTSYIAGGGGGPNSAGFSQNNWNTQSGGFVNGGFFNNWSNSNYGTTSLLGFDGYSKFSFEVRSGNGLTVAFRLALTAGPSAGVVTPCAANKASVMNAAQLELVNSRVSEVSRAGAQIIPIDNVGVNLTNNTSAVDNSENAPNVAHVVNTGAADITVFGLVGPDVTISVGLASSFVRDPDTGSWYATGT